MKEEKDKYKNMLTTKQNEINILSNKYNELNNKINSSKDEKIISLLITSIDENLALPIMIKDTDYFTKVKEIIFEKYPNYKKTTNKFYVCGKIIKMIDENKKIKENDLKDGDNITLVQSQ